MTSGKTKQEETFQKNNRKIAENKDYKRPFKDN